MSKEISKKDILKNSIVFLGLIGITFFILFKDSSLTNIVSALKTVNLYYILIGVMCMFMFLFCEGINIKMMLKLFSYKISIWDGLKYSFVGFFFSSITPSSSGGQPMQVYYMAKDKIKLAHSSVVLLIGLATFQAVTIGIAVISIIGNFNFILQLHSVVKLLIFIGIITNLLILIFIILALFSNKFINNVINIIFKVIDKIKVLDSEGLRAVVDKEIHQYKEGAFFIKSNKSVMIKVFFTTIIQICSMYSITFLVYKAFNLSAYSYFTVFSLQSILFIAASAIPLPGAVGTSEGSFLTLFKTLFPASTLSSAMLLSRGISFYLFVIISGIIILTIKAFSKKLSKEKVYG